MKIVGIAQRGTESGLTRIRDLVASDEIEFLYLKDFKKFKINCSKTGTTEESIAQAEKLGFKTNLVAINPLDETIKVP